MNNLLNKMNVFKAYPRDALLYILASFINSSGKALMWPLITLYVSTELGRTYGEAGMVILLQGLFSIFGEVIGGLLYHRVGARKLIVFSTGSSAILILSIVFITDWYSYIAIMSLLGMMNGITMPGIHSYIGFRWKEHRKRLFNFVYVCNNLGLAFGAAGGGLLASISFQLTYLVTGSITLFFTFFLFYFMKQDSSNNIEVSKGRMAKHKTPIQLLSNYRIFLFLSLGATFYWITFNFWGTGVGPYLVESGYDISVYSFLWTINGIVILAGQPITTFLKNTMAKTINSQLVAAAIFCVIGYSFLVFLHDNYVYFMIGMVVCTIGEMLILPPIPLYFSENTGNAAPFYLGISGGFASAGRMVGPLIIGNLYDIWGMISILVFVMVISFVTLTFFVIHSYSNRIISQSNRTYVETF